MSFSLRLIALALSLGSLSAFASPARSSSSVSPTGNENTTSHAGPRTSCFPSQSFQMPDDVPDSLDGWWCDLSTEYAFVGFSYEVTDCQSKSQLNKEFKDMKQTFKSRYVRLYGACDRKGFYDDIVDAAWNNGLGVHALIWFGFDGDDLWETRRDTLFSSLKSNPKAKFVTRVVQFGSEPLYDYVLESSDLAAQVKTAKKTLAPLGIKVTVSEMAYGYQEHGGAQEVLDALDFINIHMLPYFSAQASTSDQAWPIVTTDNNWFIAHGNGKKMYWDENGWPSTHYPGVEPNSPNAVSNVQNEQGYYKLLDSKCSTFKTMPGGGVGWFWHIYSDDQEPGYGLYDDSGNLKFSFQPKISC